MCRNSIVYGSYTLCPVTDFNIFTGFSCLEDSCTDRDLDDFIQNDAANHYRDKIAITYKLVFTNSPDIPLGFVTLQNDAITVDKDSQSKEVQMYPYRAFPAVKIGRLGITKDMQRNHLGTMLLSMVKELMVSENRTGCRYLTVDAWHNKKLKIDASIFYAKNGFIELTSRNKTSSTIPMYFDLASSDHYLP